MILILRTVHSTSESRIKERDNVITPSNGEPEPAFVYFDFVDSVDESRDNLMFNHFLYFHYIFRG